MGIKKEGEDKKTEVMREIDKMLNDRILNSGEGYSSDIINVPIEIYEKWVRTKGIK